MNDATATELYGPALYLALSNMFGGSGEPSPANYSEFYVQAAMMLVGSSLWAYIIGSACGIIATLDPQGVEFRQTMDELNYFAKDKDLPQHLTIKLRTFFQNTQHVIFSKSYDDLLNKMSPLLRGEAALRVAAQSIGKLPYFAADQVEHAFLATAALKMKTGVYSLREHLPIYHLTIIERGIAAREGRLMVKGTCLGHDMILELPHLRNWSSALALTVVLQVMTLSREDLAEVLLESPKASDLVRRHAFRLAFQRLIQRVADEYRFERAEQLAASGGATAKLDFLRLTVPTAVERAHERAKKNLVSVDLDGKSFKASAENPSPAFSMPSDFQMADRQEPLLEQHRASHSLPAMASKIERVEAKLDEVVKALANMAASMEPKVVTQKSRPRRRAANALGSSAHEEDVGATASRLAMDGGCGAHGNNGDAWEMKSRGPKLVMERSASNVVAPASCQSSGNLALGSATLAERGRTGTGAPGCDKDASVVAESNSKSSTSLAA